MESIIARALEYTLKYYLKSFSRDQFKLQGRTAQLSNLDLNGDALHASLGFPPALNVTTARVGKLEIILPPVSYVQVEPIILQIDKLDLVLEENDDMDTTSRSSTSSSSSTSGSGYGYADKIADGMTVQVGTVNLMLETHGGARQRGGGATWASPMASITIRNLVLYTTNENWEVVNLKEARDFSNDKKFIYVFKKLEWEHLSIDLLPHPDMFADINFSVSEEESVRKDEDGAKRVFFGGERFIEGISGEANITIQRTELNSPLGLEVQIHITEAVCPALSEPGLRALLRFFTGLYVCLNRGDLNPSARQRPTEAAGRSLVSLVVDHIFLCIKDADFQLELLMQSLFFSRASVSGGENVKHLTQVLIGGLFLRDTFSRPPCTLVQPSMEAATADVSHVPEFVNNFCPPICPLEDQKWQQTYGVPLISLYSLQLLPTPSPPDFASRTVVDCQPLTIHLQEESCLRISSFLADGIVINPGDTLPDFSVNSLAFYLKGLDITVPLEMSGPEYTSSSCEAPSKNSFSGARLHIEDLMFTESPSLKPKLLNLDNDAACFCLWKGQPIDASQKKLITQASLICLSLDTCNEYSQSSNLWRCVEMKDVCFEVAMVTADGSPLTHVPPPGGIVRVGFACQQYLSNTSVEQLFFVLDLCNYFAAVSERISGVGKNKNKNKTLKPKRNDSFSGTVMENVPGDTAVTLFVKDMQLNFLESSSSEVQGMALVRFTGEGLSIKVGHRTLGGAMAISSNLRWEKVEVDCVETLNSLKHEDDNDSSQLRAVFWVQNEGNYQSSTGNCKQSFLELAMNHVIPYSAQDIGCHSLNVSACMAGVRLGGGMIFTEALLHRFGIFAPDGGPGTGLARGLEHLSSGPLSKLFKSSPLVTDEIGQIGNLGDGKDSSVLQLGPPDDVDISLELKDWLFALEGAQEIEDRWSNHDSYREEKSWLTTFQRVRVKAKGNPKHVTGGSGITSPKQKYPVELITVGLESLRILKPKHQQGILSNGNPEKIAPQNGLSETKSQTLDKHGGVNVEVDLVTSSDDADDSMVNWVVENLKFSVKESIEAVVKKDELQHLVHLCKSELDSMGRIAAGVLRILKLEGSIGSAALSQLSNLGSENFERIFTPDRLSRSTSNSLTENRPSYNTGDANRNSNLKLTVASLEGAVLDSQAQCTALDTLLSSSNSSDELIDTVRDLNEKLERMQRLLDHLRTEM